MLAILGRGQSVIEFRNHASNFPRIFVVNKFDDEIDAVGPKHFKNKDLIHVHGPAFNHNLSPEHRKLFRSILILRNNNDLTPVMMHRGYPVTTPWDQIIGSDPQNHQALISRLDEEQEQMVVEWKKKRPKISGRWWPTIGIFAIEYALVVDQPDELHLFGFDFYESDYVREKAPEYSTTPKISSMMRYHLSALIEEFSQTEFHIFTRSKNFRPGNNNCRLHAS